MDRDRTKLLVAMLLSALVLIGWPVATRYLYPSPPPEPIASMEAPSEPSGGDPTTPAGKPTTPPPTPASPASPAPTSASVSPPTAALATQAPPREVTVETPFWRIKFSNRGGVATSWVLKQERVDSVIRTITAADGSQLELIPQEALAIGGAPFRLRLPWSPEIGEQLNQSNFEVSGLPTDANQVQLQSGQQLDLVFSYRSAMVTARKTFSLHADQMIFDTQVEVSVNGGEQPVELVIGPRFGDQTEHQTGSYAVPPQVCALRIDDSNQRIIGANITPIFAQITQVDPASNRLQINKPLAGDVQQVKIIGTDEVTLAGYAHVVGREANSTVLTLDALPQGVAAGYHLAQGTDTVRAGYKWAALVDRYFALVVAPPLPMGEITLTSFKLKSEHEAGVRDYPSLAVGVPQHTPVKIFVGPKDSHLLTEVSRQLGTNLETLIDYGFFARIVRPLIGPIEWSLGNLSRVFGNYGWAIVVVTVIINLALSPLRWYSSKKMKKAAKHQPRMKELQEKLKRLKENPKKNEREMMELQKEQMELMKEANPLGGCLPLLLQMPIFWAFFIYLTVSLDVRHQPWVLWIKDLSKSDPYYLLPIIMCVTMIASTWLTPQPTTGDPAMKMQRVMMTWLMPILLTWLFFLSAPTGLVLYWMVGNVVGVFIQLTINRLNKEPEAQQAVVSAGSKKRAK